MAREAYVRTVDVQSGDETDDGPFLTEGAALAFAESHAAAYFSDDGETWVEPAGDGVWHVGRVDEQGARSDSLVTITVEDREVELPEDPGLT